jgi:hypothetical protein
MIWEGIEVTAKKGMKKIVSAKNIPLFEQNLMISTVLDITERQNLQTQLQQAQKPVLHMRLLSVHSAHDSPFAL